MLKPSPDDNLEIGDIVLVHDIHMNFLGRGKFLGCEEIEDLPFDDFQIELSDGSVIHGYECWWIAEKKVVSNN